MLFYTPTFLIFLIVFIICQRIVPFRFTLPYITVASTIFYGWWYPPYVPILLFFFIFTYYAGLHFSKPNTAKHLPIFILVALSPLLFFKYTGFIVENLNHLISVDFTLKGDWALPLGISFITFTSIAYFIDVSRKKAVAQNDFWRVAAFISYFPQLLAGPILRGSELMHQLHKVRALQSMFKFALLLFAIGAFKKVGIADQVAPHVDRVYSATGAVSFSDALTALYGFSIQIYGDFSGYTDMALALGYLMGVRFPLNFNRPYMAASIREFWRHWHMTLSRWLRDYLYIPLGGNRRGEVVAVSAVFTTMLIGGLWHGAAWSFVVWGGLHGLMIALERIAQNARISFQKIPRFVKVILVFHFVSLAWIFFRAPSFERAMEVLEGLISVGPIHAMANSPIVPFFVLLTLILHRFDNLVHIRWLSRKASVAIVFPIAVGLILTCAAISVGNPSAFIYFDF